MTENTESKTNEEQIYLRFSPNDMIADKYFGKATEAFFLEVGYDSVFTWGTDFKSDKQRDALKNAVNTILDNIDQEIS